MTPPLAPGTGTTTPDTGSGAVLSCPRGKGLTVLTQRADFIRASGGLRQATPGFHLQARAGNDRDRVRIGYTCSRKVGNAVARNRAKRRLREVARAVLPVHGQPGWDYVLVGRAGVTAIHDFAAMQADLIRALAQVHRPQLHGPQSHGPQSHRPQLQPPRS